MNTYKNTNDTDCRTSNCNQVLAKSLSDTSKEKWLQKYATRILTHWSQWQTPLGVACDYTEKIKKDLVRFYDDPLKRLFIEATY